MNYTRTATIDYVYENGVWLYHENVTPTEHGYWVEAKDLRVGDVFLGANGDLSTLTNIVRIEQAGGIAVFNCLSTRICGWNLVRGVSQVREIA